MNQEDVCPSSTSLTVPSSSHRLLAADSIQSAAVEPADDLAPVGRAQHPQTQMSIEMRASGVAHVPASADLAARLAPGQRKAAITGIDRGRVAAPRLKGAKSCRPPSVREDLHRRLCEIKQALDEVYPRPLKDWEKRIWANHDAEQEIALWTHIVATYRRCLAGRVLTPGQRREYFHLILACSTTPKRRVMEVTHFSALSREQAQEAVEFYGSARV
jgi:hypothetical protein